MFTKRSTSGFFMVLAIFNLIFAVAPPIAGAVGVYGMMKDSDIIINGKQVGPEFDKEVAKEAPLAKIESFAALAGNSLSFLLIVIGSAGLFMGYGWGRWAAVAGAAFMILSLLVHDIYQIFIYRPALMAVVDRIANPIINFPPDEPARNFIRGTVTAIKAGMTMYTMAWSCSNPIIMLYLFVMVMCMAFMEGFYDAGSIEKNGRIPSHRDDDDEDEEDEEEDDDDDRRPAKKKRKDRGDYEED